MALFGRLDGRRIPAVRGAQYGLDAATTLNRTRELLEFMQLAGEPEKADRRLLAGRHAEEAGSRGSGHSRAEGAVSSTSLSKGVDAVAAGTLKAMLLENDWRAAATIFLTSLGSVTWRLWRAAVDAHRHQFTRGVWWGRVRLMSCGAGTWRIGQAGTQDAVASPGEGKTQAWKQIFLEIVGTDREGNPAATAPEQELSWLS